MIQQRIVASSAVRPVGWYAVETKPGAEYIAETDLRRIGVEVYLPQYRRAWRYRRSKKQLVRLFPLFAGYLFVTAALDWAALYACKGIERDGVLCDSDGKPVSIGDAEIEAIRLKAESGEFDEVPTPARPIKLVAGESIDLPHGLKALVKRASSRNARVLTTMFGREVEAVVPVAKIKKEN